MLFTMLLFLSHLKPWKKKLILRSTVVLRYMVSDAQSVNFPADGRLHPICQRDSWVENARVECIMTQFHQAKWRFLMDVQKECDIPRDHLPLVTAPFILNSTRAPEDNIFKSTTQQFLNFQPRKWEIIASV